MKKKMSLKQLKALFSFERLPVPGNPNLHTRATAKGHIHKVNPASRPSRGVSSHSRRRHERILRAFGHLKG